MVTRHYLLIWDLERCMCCQIGPQVCPMEAVTYVQAMLQDGRMIEKQSVDVIA